MSEEAAQVLTWVALLVAAALFGVVKAAVLSADTSSFQKMAEAQGGAWSRRVLSILSAPRRFITAMELWTFALTLWVGVQVALHYTVPGVDPSPSPLLLLGIMAVLAVAVGFFVIALPGRLAALRPFGLLKLLLWPAYALALPLWPLCWLMDVLSQGLVRLFGLRPGPETEEVSEDEIRAMVDMGGESGAIEATEKEMIDNIFEFNNMDAEDIMVHRTDMVIVWEEDTEAEILATIRDSGLSRFPVCREDVDDVIGILSTRDYLLNYRAEHPKSLEELLRPAYFVPESVKADALFRHMQQQKVHMAIVVDEYGGTSGLLTMEDLLEQLVGEIYDEFDSEEELEILPLGDNLWRIRGSAELDQVAEALGIELPESDEYDTLGGLIFSCLTVIPEDGNHPEMDIDGLHIVVDELLDRRVEWARVSVLAPAERTEAEG